MYIFKLCAAFWQDFRQLEIGLSTHNWMYVRKKNCFQYLIQIFDPVETRIDVMFFTYQMFDFEFLVTIGPNYFWKSVWIVSMFENKYNEFVLKETLVPLS